VAAAPAVHRQGLWGQVLRLPDTVLAAAARPHAIMSGLYSAVSVRRGFASLLNFARSEGDMAIDAGVIVETTGGLIINRIVWSEEVPSMDFGDGVEVLQEPADASYVIGGRLIGGVYTAPPEPPPPEPPPPEPPPPPTPEQQLLFDHENRIRAQEGQPPLELGDFVDKMKGG
jgi:hypothetical protein